MPVHTGNTWALIPTLLSPYFSSDTSVRSSNRLQKIEKWWPHTWVELRDLKHSADLSLLTRTSEQTEHSTKRVSWIKVCQMKWWLCTYNHKGGGWSWMVQRWSTNKTHQMDQRGWHMGPLPTLSMNYILSSHCCLALMRWMSYSWSDFIFISSYIRLPWLTTGMMVIYDGTKDTKRQLSTVQEGVPMPELICIISFSVTLTYIYGCQWLKGPLLIRYFAW